MDPKHNRFECGGGLAGLARGNIGREYVQGQAIKVSG
jgi:hypothetical protein